MSMLVWIMVGIAIWHFCVWVPDRFWGGIVGAFLVAVFGSAIFGFIASGLSIPSQEPAGIGAALLGIPGALIALGASYWYGSRLEERSGH
jgi:hypothetical protein